MFDLFWLRQNQVGELCAPGLHHGPMDSSKTTNTAINVFQQTLAISQNLRDLDKKWSRDLLVRMQREGRTSFTLSPEFKGICSQLRITIPFEEIDEQTYLDNILRILEQRIQIEKEGIGNKESK